MKKFDYEITIMIFKKDKRIVSQLIESVSIVAENYFEGRHKAIKQIEEKMISTSEELANCVALGNIFFGVRWCI